MSLVIQKTWSMYVKNNYNGVDNTTSGTISDTIKDERPLTRRTPRDKWRPPTPYYRTIWQGDNNCYTVSLYSKRHDYRLGNQYYSLVTKAGASNASGYYGIALPSPSSNFENKAILKARMKLKNTQVSIPQAIGERKQTIRLVGDNLKQLYRMVKNVRRLKPGRLIRNDILKESWFFDRWLELQYGWKPLLQDCHGAVYALHERELERGPPITTVIAVVREVDRSIRRLTDSANTRIWDFDQVAETQHKGKIRLDFVESGSVMSGNALKDLGLTNPLEVAWELTPWSFVADWFLPIGDYLSQLDATNGWDFKGGSFSIKSEQRIIARNFKLRPDDYEKPVSEYIYCAGSGRKMQLTRTTYSEAPLATLPDFSKLVKTGHPVHLANGIALLMGAIIGGHRVR